MSRFFAFQIVTSMAALLTPATVISLATGTINQSFLRLIALRYTRVAVSRLPLALRTLRAVVRYDHFVRWSALFACYR